MPKVSVIIPVFKIEQYIEQCSRSLFEQTIQDIEYIFVDDSSPDQSISILHRVLQDYPNRKSQVRILHHKDNKGVSEARRTGFINATGEYIANCDGDDWVDKRMYDTLYSKAIENQADLLFCDYFIVKNGFINEYHKKINSTSKDYLMKRLLSSHSLNSLWSVLVKKNIIDEGIIRYPYGSMSEDKTLLIQFVTKSKSISFTDECLYYYRYIDTSISHSIHRSKVYKQFEDTISNQRMIIDMLSKDQCDKYKNELVAYKFDAKMLLYSQLSNEEMYAVWKKTYPEISNSIIRNPYINYKLKIYFIFAKIGIIRHFAIDEN